MTAYRTAPLTPPVAPPWWQRAAAKVAPGLSGASEWQWYRAAKGGRWCLVRLFDDKGREVGVMWARVQACPAELMRHIEPGSARLAPWWHGVVFDGRDPLPLLWYAAPLAGHRERCTCEVYP